MKQVFLALAVFFNTPSFSATYQLESGKSYEIAGNVYECQAASNTAPKITCRFDRATKKDYDYVATHYDHTATGSDVKSTLLSACKVCIQSMLYSTDTCRFLECFSSLDGSTVNVSYDYFRLLPRECR